MTRPVCEERRRRITCDRGAATAEFAMVLPALVLLLALFAGAATVGMTQLRAYDAARAAAREAARGEPQHTVVAEAEKRAGASSKVTIRTEGGYTEVAVVIGLPRPVSMVLKQVASSATARTEGS
ncbi:TadE family type IV pilus minor pilin [Brevibacterium luteolum]|uniref:TadE family type IV pilus minor pilin n=1 Tax=Brevibacterium luteolum TaxID=199591 RepID=UPI001C215206|nr:TadE family type IV pilus minor pilin [Brevibacterium luteolum]MBU8578622.1 pilus assembly protein [Brevibacterium luteolum]